MTEPDADAMTTWFEWARFDDVSAGRKGMVVATVRHEASWAEIVYEDDAPELGIGINLISTDPASRGQGQATIVLGRIVALADELALPVTLVAVPVGDGRMTLDRLVEWYEKRGFIGSGRSPAYREMIRRPQTPITPEGTGETSKP